MIGDNPNTPKESSINPARIIFLSFLIIILTGSFLLSLPFATVKPIKYIDALYTSTSAVCVTGLIVKDTPKDFTKTGQLIILSLIQIGGLGIMTFSLLFLSIFSKKLTIKDSIIAGEITGQSKFNEIKDIIKYVVLFTFAVEFTGFLLLFVKFVNKFSIKKAIFTSVFHSVSAFCNAGFSTFSNNLSDYNSDVWINLTIISLIITGGIGFVVVFELQNYFSNRHKQKKKIIISLHTRLTLIATGILIIIGTILIFIFEFDNQLKQFSDISSKLLASLFQSVTCRTAGFNSLNIAELSQSSLLTSIALMFIGGSPCSTAGGIKTTTFAVLILTLIAMIKDNDKVELYHKQIPKYLI
ncbi:hypothetical protein KA977_15205, partial [Candidatus Dependentiae bacterium]|nr:hypothetical protein [Candidatus Dependentiae bacterium]